MKIGSREIGSPEVGSLEIGLKEVGSLEISTQEVGSFEMGIQCGVAAISASCRSKLAYVADTPVSAT